MDNDAKQGDNTCKLIAVSEDGLESDEATGNASLTWSKPDQGGIPEGSFAESFEGFEEFEIEKLGDWTIHNIDGSFTYTINGFYWENTYMDRAWIVWCPSKVQNMLGDEALSDNWTPHTGDKCMACRAEDPVSRRGLVLCPWLKLGAILKIYCY